MALLQHPILTFVLTFEHSQITGSSEKSCEVLLSHIISELSKGKIYCANNTDQPSMVGTNWQLYQISSVYLISHHVKCNQDLHLFSLESIASIFLLLPYLPIYSNKLENLTCLPHEAT